MIPPERSTIQVTVKATLQFLTDSEYLDIRPLTVDDVTDAVIDIVRHDYVHEIVTATVIALGDHNAFDDSNQVEISKIVSEVGMAVIEAEG